MTTATRRDILVEGKGVFGLRLQQC